MEALNVQLFGKFTLRRDASVLPEIAAVKAQELFSYLALNRDRPHSRETLSGLLWRDGSAERARKCLRQTLWQLQSSLQPLDIEDDEKLLLIDASWVSFNSEVNLTVDAVDMERAFRLVRDVPGICFNAETEDLVQRATRLYGGDLLEGWYHDWCLFERERFQAIYLTLLDKLMQYSEAHGECEGGIAYGQEILRIDPAREHTHRHLMRLYALSGDRTSALRQYNHCRAALREEFDVEPEGHTADLAARIRADQLPDRSIVPARLPNIAASLDHASPADASTRLSHLRMTLSNVTWELERNIQAVEACLNAPGPSA